MPGLREKESTDFRLIFALAFFAFLLEAIGRRVVMRAMRIEGGAEGEKSVIAEAKAAACKYVPFAFMG
ncbi:hypothetical protein A33M_1600 [Rhodovulum sp. PH10]|nr:hypothetical protein A33M_1600 [Rhodovulum sp. PH10]